MSSLVRSLQTRHMDNTIASNSHQTDLELDLSSATQPKTPRETYIQSIRSCYAFHPGAFRYYEELVDYISSTSGDDHNNQSNAPKVYRIIDQLDIAASCDTSSSFGMSPFVPCSLETDAKLHKIAIVEGLPSPDAISSLGSKFSIRPELFLGHLDLRRKQAQPQLFYELPNLPSNRGSIVHIKTVNFGKRLVKYSLDESIERMRSSASENCRRSNADVLRELRYGSTRIRNINIHDDKVFSYEQLISLFFSTDSRTSDSWNVICLFDQGRHHMESKYFPWADYGTSGRPIGHVPIVPYDKYAYQTTHTDNGHDLIEKLQILDDFHPLKVAQPKNRIDAALLSSSPFYILRCLLSAAISSWNMLLNLIEEDLNSHAPKSLFGVEEMHQLRFNANLIESTLAFAGEHTPTVRAGGSTAWPASHDKSVEARKEYLQAGLLTDLQALESRCARLARQCETRVSLLVSLTQLEESKKAVIQAQQVQSLTQLAFIFIPASFISSVFGMNVSQLKNGPSIWIFFVVAFTCSSIAWTFVSWDTISRFARRIRRKFRRRESWKTV